MGPMAEVDSSGDHAFVDLVTDEPAPTPHSLAGAPLRVRVALVSVLSTITALLFGVGALSLFPAGAAWPTAVSVIGRAALALAAVSLVYLTIRANGSRADDAAARVAHVLLGIGWLLFSWGLITGVGRLVLAIAGMPNPLRARLVALTLAALVVGLAIWGFWAARRVPPIRRTTVAIEGLVQPLTVAVLTDTHFDAWTTPAWAQAIVARVNSENPDLVVHAGDLADGSVRARRPQVEALAQISTPQRYYIAGNHEYYSDAPAWMGFMSEIGWEVLVNRHLVHRGLVVAGLDDPTGTSMAQRGPDLDAALLGAPDLPVLLLAHQPHQVAEALDRVDLQISGHTHGGQIWPFHYMVRLREPVVAGLARASRRTQLYVSRGAGFWGPPFRIFAPSEISLLSLVPAEAVSSAKTR